MTTAFDEGQAPEIELRHRMMIARIEAGLSQKQLADAVGVSRTTVSNTEVGTSTPRRLLVNAWALATGVPVTWLLTGQAPRAPEPDAVQSPPSGLNRRPSLYKGGGAGATVTDLSDLRTRRRKSAPAVLPAAA